MEKPIKAHYEQPNLYIFHDRKLVYLLMSKVACSSMNANITKAYGVVKSKAKIGPYRRDYHWEEAGIKIAIGGLSGACGGSDYFKFAFVRNPFDRLVSCYKDKVLNKDRKKTPYFEAAYKYYDQYPMIRDMSFEAFVDMVISIPAHLADRHFKPQHYFICPPGEKLVFDFIGRFENLADDWRYIATRFNFDPVLPRRNATDTSRGSKDFYTPELLEKVYHYYKDDVQLFGYQEAYETLRDQVEKTTAKISAL